jgi:flagellar basal body-associated protein FliL
MLQVTIVLALAAAAFVAFSFRKKSSHDDVKTSGPVNPIVVENTTPDPTVFVPVVEEPVATPEQKAERKANAAKQGAAKQGTAKQGTAKQSAVKKTVVKKTK